MGWSSGRRRCSTSRPSPANRSPSSTSPATGSAAAPSTPADAFDLRATTSAAESTYAGIVRLVAEAESASSPFVRLADRYALAFLLASVALAGLAWLVSGDPVRAVAVLVVATPCPLILAAPVAIVSGLSTAAERGVVVKGGAALERLGRGEVLLFDKTGTLTEGRPTRVRRGHGRRPDRPSEILRLAASARPGVRRTCWPAPSCAPPASAAWTWTLPTEVSEVAGHGVRGRVDGRDVAVGKAAGCVPGVPPPWARAVRRRADLDGALTMFVEVDGEPAGAIAARRPDPARRRPHDPQPATATGSSGSSWSPATAPTSPRPSAQSIGVDEVLAERTPAEKVDAVAAEGRTHRTIMVGDGINDAPALALADVGVAIGARGPTASSEAADVVLTVDRLDRLGEAIVIARRTQRIARQSVVAGIGLSVAAMVVAAFGFLPPAWGALLQEAIDVAVILNALRVLTRHAGEVRVDAEERGCSRAVLGRAPHACAPRGPVARGGRPDRRPIAGRGDRRGTRRARCSWSTSCCPTSRPRTLCFTPCSPASSAAATRPAR